MKPLIAIALIVASVSAIAETGSLQGSQMVTSPQGALIWRCTYLSASGRMMQLDMPPGQSCPASISM